MGLRARWRALHGWTRAGAIAGALAVLLPLTPVSAAVLLLRCCNASRGAQPGAWAIVAVALALVAVVGAVLGGLLGAGVRRLLNR